MGTKIDTSYYNWINDQMDAIIQLTDDENRAALASSFLMTGLRLFEALHGTEKLPFLCGEAVKIRKQVNAAERSRKGYLENVEKNHQFMPPGSPLA